MRAPDSDDPPTCGNRPTDMRRSHTFPGPAGGSDRAAEFARRCFVWHCPPDRLRPDNVPATSKCRYSDRHRTAHTPSRTLRSNVDTRQAVTHCDPADTSFAHRLVWPRPVRVVFPARPATPLYPPRDPVATVTRRQAAGRPQDHQARCRQTIHLRSPAAPSQRPAPCQAAHPSDSAPWNLLRNPPAAMSRVQPPPVRDLRPRSCHRGVHWQSPRGDHDTTP